jgi:hypothetical protein
MLALSPNIKANTCLQTTKKWGKITKTIPREIGRMTRKKRGIHNSGGISTRPSCLVWVYFAVTGIPDWTEYVKYENRC